MEKRFLMKWLHNPFTDGAWWRLKRAWWQIVAPGLMKENRQYAEMCDRYFDDYDKHAKEIEELEREKHRDRHFHGRIGAGYWYVHVGKNVSSVSRIDEKFIEWYEKWVTPIQNKFVFEYERPETKEEEKRREQTYLEMHDERYRD